ncbi:MAG: heavy metal transporter [Bacillales bacterium]|jgi:hypothetical protein|nr:heavy metal transporter [Bacillales bacterium]
MMNKQSLILGGIAFVMMGIAVSLNFSGIVTAKNEIFNQSNNPVTSTEQGGFLNTNLVNNTTTQNTSVNEIVVGQVVGDSQSVEVNVTGSGFEPTVIVLEKNLKTSFKFNQLQGGCDQYVVFPQLNSYIDISNKDTIIITPIEDFTIQCSMGMYMTHVKVVDDIKTVDMNQIKQEILDNPDLYSQGSGCGMSQGGSSSSGCCGM